MKRRNIELRAPAESSHVENPRNTTSLSTSSLVRPDANFPLNSFASAAATAAATSIPFKPVFSGTNLTDPMASADFHAAPCAINSGEALAAVKGGGCVSGRAAGCSCAAHEGQLVTLAAYPKLR